MQSAMARVGLLGRDAPRFTLADATSRQGKSDILRQLLGFENSRITTVVRKARTFSGIDNILSPSTEIGPAGLGNWDNSCYQNSVLHGFASLPAFNTFVSKSWDLMKRRDTRAPTHEALVGFLGTLNASDQPKRTLWTPAVLKSMDSWQQQDAQEYFSRVLDAVEKEDARLYKKIKRKDGWDVLPIGNEPESSNSGAISIVADEDAVVSTETESLIPTHRNTRSKLDRSAGFSDRNPLDGMLAQSLKCSTCGFSEGLALTQFNCITVNLGTAGGSCTLEKLLDEYTEPEDIDGVECTQCTKLANTVPEPAANEAPAAKGPAEREDESSTTRTSRKKPKPVLSTKSKQLTIGRLPEDLVIHLNRSIFDMYGNQRKNTALVDFPLRLSILNRWCAPLDDVDGRAVQALYALQCVVTHAGRHDDGHYIAYAKRGKNWYCFNDEVVMNVSEEFVCNRGNAFMLFYERDCSPTVLEDMTAPRGITEEVLHDVSVATLIEKDPSKQPTIDGKAPTDTLTYVEDPVAKPNSPLAQTSAAIYPRTPSMPSDETDEDTAPSSTAPSDADYEGEQQPEARLEALLPPMRTAIESSAMHRGMESSHAAPVF